jgi:outer membrane receptor protein involved in Fe transport
VKASFGNEKLFKNFGFNVSGRYNTSYLWQSTFADGIAAATVIDAQVNYELPKLKSTLKLGLQILVVGIWTSIRSWIDQATILCFLDN